MAINLTFSAGRNIMPFFTQKRPHALPICLIVALSVLIYIRALFSGFVFDDFYLILDNRWLTSLAFIPEILSSPTWAFHEGTFSGGSSNYYRPVMHLVSLFGYQLFGFSPPGFHAVSIGFHAISAVFVYLIASSLFSSQKGPDESGAEGAPRSFPLFAGLFFAAHPVNVEPVVWISSISEISLGLFFFISIYCFILKREKNSLAWEAVSVAAYFAAMLSKETGIVLPLVLFLFDRPMGNLRELIRRYLPFAVAASLYLVIRAVVIGGGQTSHAAQEGAYPATILSLTAQYITKLIYPAGLKIYYLFEPVGSVLSLGAFEVVSLIIAAACVIIALLQRGKAGRALPAGLALLLVPLLPPILGFRYIHGERLISERYLYIPSAGFAIILSYALWRLLYLRASFLKAAIIVSILITIAYSAITVKRSVLWRDELTYWSETVRSAPGSALTHANLAVALTEAGSFDEALREYALAKEIRPAWDELYVNMAGLYYNMKDNAGALDALKTALGLTRNMTVRRRVFAKMGMIYFAEGDYDSAIESYQLATGLAGGNKADLYNRLGAAYASGGMMGDARWAFEEALKINPAHEGARINLEKARSLAGPTE